MENNLMKRIQLLLLLIILAVPLAAQINGNLQYIGDKAILHVWGNHHQRGYAQGYLLAGPTLDIFDEFFYSMFMYSNPAHYAYLFNYYLDHFDSDPRLAEEAQGLVGGIAASGASLYHAGLQRDLTYEDLLFANSFIDLLHVRNALGDEELSFGCASLSSWGISTQQDSLLAGSPVITRWLDWTLYNCLIDNPLLIVHHPSEPDEQKWLTITFPGWLGAPSALSETGVWASLNMGNDHNVVLPNELDPILFDVRRSLERADYNGDGISNALDVGSAIQNGNHLAGTIIHTLSETAGEVLSIVVETNNSGTALRYYDSPNSSLAGQNLAATNSFRLLTLPTCCSRYANIQDSLNANHHITAKRQWSLMSGAAGQETNLSAIQFDSSTGTILWAGASYTQPAYQNPAVLLSAQALFDFSTPVLDPYLPAIQPSFFCHPNPVSASSPLNIKSSTPFSSYSIYNTRGQKVFSQELADAKLETEIGLPQLPTGLYLISLAGKQGFSAVRKLVILP